MGAGRAKSIPLICLGHPVGTVGLLSAVVVAGAVAFRNLPIGLMPDIVYPMVRVQVTAGQSPPELLVSMVTRPLEQELAQAEGLELIESTTEQGRVQVTLSFAQSRDVDEALRDVVAWVNRARARLPQDISPPEIFKFDPQNLPVLEFTLSSTSVDLRELRHFAENDLVFRFAGVPGVSALRVAGGRVREVQVQVDVERARGYALTLQDISSALSTARTRDPSGRVDAAGKEWTGQVISDFATVQDIGAIAIPLPSGKTIDLSDVAEVLDTHQEQRMYVTVNGEEAVKVSVYKALQANSVQVAEAVAARLDDLQADGVITDEVTVAITSDESIYIRESIESARHALLLAISLVACVILIFLKDWKFTLFSLLVIPVAILITALLMKPFGLSLNLMSIGGFILGVTLLVDYGIVLLENITRHWSRTRSMEQAVAEASQEVGYALGASMTALIAAVVPFLFLGGVAVLFFKEFILTIIFASVSGLLAAFTVIPALYPVIGRFTSHERIAEGRMVEAATSAYARVLGFCTLHGRWIVAVALAGLGASLYELTQLGYVFLPEIDDGRVTITLQAEPGTPLDEFRRDAERVEALARSDEAVELVDATVGGRIGQTIQITPSESEILVQLVPKRKRNVSVQQWISEFDKKAMDLTLAGTDVRVKKARIRAIRTFKGQAAFGDYDVAIRIQGQEVAVLADLAEEVRERLRAIEGLTDVKPSLVMGQPLMNLVVDRPAARVFQLTPDTIGQAVRTAVNGEVAARFPEGGLFYGVRVLANRMPGRDFLGLLRTIPVGRLSAGGLVLLDQVARVDFANGPLAIDRIGQSSVNLVTATVRGRTLGEVASQIRSELSVLPLPAGYSIGYGGRMALLTSESGHLPWVVGLAAFLVLVVLVVLYESVTNALIVLFVLPFGVCGAVAALAVTKTPVSSTVMIGLILLVGIAANNAIVLLAFVEQLRREGTPLREAVRNGACTRLRPKVMTALIAIAGLAPLLSASQEGGEILQPLAIAVIGGMPVSLLGTLLVLPVLYVLVHGRKGNTT